jgi:PEP-CTERM motif
MNFGKLIGGALGLWIVAMPASATPINWAVGFLAQTTNYGGVPNPANSTLLYNSEAGTPNNGAAAGITFNSNDPSASYSYSPNPALSFGGLSSGMMSLTSVGSSASVTGSLASGTTHLYASSSELPLTSGNSAVSATMEDQLTFYVNGPESDTVTLGFSLDGLLSLGGEASYNQNIEYKIGTADMEWAGQSGAAPYTGNTTGFNSFAFTNDTISGFTFQGTLTVTNGETLPLFFTQFINCNDGAVCDFSNTGQMSLILPSDVTYTSNSGVFLTQGATAPEPGSVLLVGLGFVALAYVRLRRQFGS